MKKNLAELKLDFENALKCIKDNDSEELKNIKQKISSIMVIYFKLDLILISSF